MGRRTPRWLGMQRQIYPLYQTSVILPIEPPPLTPSELAGGGRHVETESHPRIDFVDVLPTWSAIPQGRKRQFGCRDRQVGNRVQTKAAIRVHWHLRFPRR